MRTLKLILAYDGGAYSGWQRQPQADRPTVQRVVEDAVGAITGVAGPVYASGRTDAGVHALGQVAHLHTESAIPAGSLLRALNATLPADVAVFALDEVDGEFHARFGARRKTYFYQCHVGPERHPLWRRYALHLRHWPDLERIRQAAGLLVGRHDFRSFVTDSAERDDTVRGLAALRVIRTAHGFRIFATADGFLRHMVRSLSGLLLKVGQGQEELSRVPAILAARDRCEAPAALPPHGLFLWKVDY